MRELEQYVRGSQLPEPKPTRPALLRPSSVPARTASGSLGRRGEAQTPFESYVPLGDGGGSSGEVTPLPVGDVTLLDHSSGTPIDVSQASSVVLRMNSLLHIFPFTVSARNLGGNRVWKCDLFIEPGGVPLQFDNISNVFNGSSFLDGGPDETLPDGTRVFYFGFYDDTRVITNVRVFSNTSGGQVQAVEGVHFEVFPMPIDHLQGIYRGLDVTGFPPSYFQVIHIKPQYTSDFGGGYPTIIYELVRVSFSRAYAQLTSSHGKFRHVGGIGEITSPTDLDATAEDVNGNQRLDLSVAQTIQFDAARKISSESPGTADPEPGRRSWWAHLVYFERSDEWLCTSAGLDPYQQ